MEINPSKCEPIIGLKKGMSVIPFVVGEFTFLYVNQESWPLLGRQTQNILPSDVYFE
jgi:hypothetical protein